MSAEILEMVLNKSSALGSLRGTTMALLTSGEINKITFQVMMNGLKSAYEAMDKQIDDYDMDRLKERAREFGVAL